MAKKDDYKEKDIERVNKLSYGWKNFHTVYVMPYEARIEGIGSVSGTNTKEIIIKETHCCGASGFGQGHDDKCPACDESKEKYDLLEKLETKIKNSGGLKPYYEQSAEKSFLEKVEEATNCMMTASSKRVSLPKIPEGLEYVIGDVFAKKFNGYNKHMVHIFSKEEIGLIGKYFSGINVTIFKYSGHLQPHLQLSIDGFGKYNCKDYNIELSVQYDEFLTNNPFFEDIREAVFLRDRYGEQAIKGLHHVHDYLWLMRDTFYQKYNIIPKMQSIGNKAE